MKISLSNVAKVEKAEIELDGITVVAGLNGSGKTTVSKAIYASINAYNRLTSRILNSRKDSIHMAVLNALNNDLELRYEYSHYEIASNFIMKLPINELIEEARSKKKELLDRFVEEQITSKVSLKKEEIAQLYKSIRNILLRTDNNYTTFLVESLFSGVFSDQINCFCNDERATVRFNLDHNVLVSRFYHDELVDNTVGVEYDKRAIYIESFNVLDLYNTSRVGLGFNRNRYSMTATEDLFRCLVRDRKSIKVYEDYANSKELERIIELIITKVTHGKLDIDPTGNIIFQDSTTNHPVKISNLSAGVKIFVIIQALLEKRQLIQGDILLIDEPEVHLHPEWQIVFAEILVLLHQKIGLIIYVNTHSPYFARAIEVKLAEYEMADKGKFYLLRENEERLCICSDVSRNTEEIYSMLYKPLERL